MRFEEAAAAEGYEIGPLAGRGGTASVFRATHLETGRPVALKLLGPGADRRRLDREGQILQSLHLDGVVRAIGAGEIDGTPYLAEEWIEAETLRQLVDGSGSLPVDTALAFFDQISEALDAVHQRGIVHRDLSLSNVMVSAEGCITIIDFGLSRSPDGGTVTGSDGLAGNPAYLAPEIIEGREPLPASDQYAAAVILFELLSGVHPFPVSATLTGSLHHQLSTPPTPLSEIWPAAPPSVEGAVARALSKRPDDRFESMGDMATALRKGPALAVDDSARPGVGAIEARRVPSHMARGAVVLAVASLGVGVAAWMLRPESVPSGDWSAGTAAALDCNLISNPGFVDPQLPENYYVNPDGSQSNRQQIVAFGGLDDSAALQVGSPDDFGLFGERIAIVPTRRYLYSAIVTVDEGSGGELRIEWLDSDFQPLPGAAAVPLSSETDRLVSILDAEPPPDAAYAVPTVFKDVSGGVMLVDELVFAPMGTACQDRVSAS